MYAVTDRWMDERMEGNVYDLQSNSSSDVVLNYSTVHVVT